ncbi:P-loop containing nucleoside triphosphate hydrolase protein [Cadophora sp. MPI-SDFR-AT-0126]|nr:P-loop containing nucleoside triphosphate hydrolase protein [Leotiomycetes sp. MPI-SDFR-AT-0126]
MAVAWHNPHTFFSGSVDPDETEGLTCEIKTYEARYNAQGERVSLQVGARREHGRLHDRDHDSALVLTRFYKTDKELDFTQLEVRSPHFKAALRAVIEDYPGVNIHSGRIVIRDLPRPIFHYREEIQRYGSQLQDPIAKEHVAFGLRHMYKTLQNEVKSYYNLMQSLHVRLPGLEFLTLWMAFRPGCLIYQKEDNVEVVLRLKDMTRCPCPKPKCWDGHWTLTAERIDHNGTDFGHVEEKIAIRPYDGYRPLQVLNAFPLEYHPEKDRIIEALVARGKSFISLMGIHHRWYSGTASALSLTRKTSVIEGEEDMFSLQSITIRGRIIIDIEGFGHKFPTHKPEFSYGKNVISTKSGEHLALREKDLIICCHRVPGFSLVNKRWCYFSIDKIKDIAFNSKAFASLLIPEYQKEMVHSLVKVHTDKNLHFDDVIRGKGKGMIFLLHGTPGVGKTLTAESIADHTQRPLYTVSSGDLGISATVVEEKLSSALDLASRWNAIVLIDEADIFLEERSAHDLKRNGLVSVFLRVLEYYEGIMFLTTNRISAFDPAFKSRIHLAIKYPSLSMQSRRNLWKSFILRGTPEHPPQWMTEQFLDRLAAEELNGRQIKNIVRTACAIATSTSNEMTTKHIAMGLKALKTFEADMNEVQAERPNSEQEGPPDSEHRSKRARH